MSLGLHERAHHAVAVEQFAVLRRQAGDDGVVGALAWGQGVGVGGVQREQPGAVVQYDAGAGHDHTRAEVGEDAVDEGAGVAFPVNHADVNGVAAPVLVLRIRLAVGSCGHGPGAVDQRAALGGVVLGEQLLGGNIHHAGVGDIAVGVGEGQAHGLYEVVVGVGRLSSHRSDVESLGDVQGLQARRGPVRWAGIPSRLRRGSR